MNISESHGDTIQNIRIESGNHALVYSNSFLLPTKDEPVTINIDTKHGFSFSMIVDFETIPNGEQELIRSVEGNMVRYKLVNFNDSLGTGTVELIYLATVKSRDWKMHIWSSVLGSEESGIRKLDISIWEGMHE